MLTITTSSPMSLINKIGDSREFQPIVAMAAVCRSISVLFANDIWPRPVRIGFSAL